MRQELLTSTVRKTSGKASIKKERGTRREGFDRHKNDATKQCIYRKGDKGSESQESNEKE